MKSDIIIKDRVQYFLKDQKYAAFFLSHSQWLLRPTEYPDRKTKQIKQSRAKTEWVDIRTPDHRSDNSRPYAPRSNDQLPTINADPVQQDTQFNPVQPSGAEVLEISTNGFNEQSSDNSASQPSEVCVEVQTNADPQLTRRQEDPQEGTQEGGPEGSQEDAQKGSKEEDSEGSDVDAVDATDANLGPTLSQMESHLFKHDFFKILSL